MITRPCALRRFWKHTESYMRHVITVKKTHFIVLLCFLTTAAAFSTNHTWRHRRSHKKSSIIQNALPSAVRNVLESNCKAFKCYGAGGFQFEVS